MKSMKEHETKLSGRKPKCHIEDTEDKRRLATRGAIKHTGGGINPLTKHKATTWTLSQGRGMSAVLSGLTLAVGVVGGTMVAAKLAWGSRRPWRTTVQQPLMKTCLYSN